MVPTVVMMSMVPTEVDDRVIGGCSIFLVCLDRQVGPIYIYLSIVTTYPIVTTIFTQFHTILSNYTHRLPLRNLTLT